MNKYKEALNYLRSSVLVTDCKQKEKVNQCTVVLKELIDKATFKKPIKRHYENEGEVPYVKYTCPNGCHIQLHPVTEKKSFV